MKLSTTLIFGMLSALTAAATAQTLFVPSGAGGVGASTTTNVGIGVSNPSPFDGGARKTLQLKDASNDALVRITGSLVDTELGVNSTGVGFLFTRTGHDLIFGTSNTERVRVGKDGNVGIGTTNPLDRLHVNGGIRTEGWGFLRGFNGTTELYRVMSQEAGEFRIASMETGRDIRFSTRDAGGTDRISLTIKAGQSPGNSGDVGVGTVTPRQRFEVMATSSPAINIHDAGTAEITIGVNESLRMAQINTNADGIRFVTGQDGVSFPGNGMEVLRLTSGGNVSIGTTNTAHKLTVNGTIRAKEVIVDTGWADYVFAEDYRLAPLSEVEAHIKAHRHLPDIPSAAEVAEKGVSMGEMQARMMAKIEELTLHIIEQEKRAAEREQVQRREIAELRAELVRLSATK